VRARGGEGGFLRRRHVSTFSGSFLGSVYFWGSPGGGGGERRSSPPPCSVAVHNGKIFSLRAFEWEWGTIRLRHFSTFSGLFSGSETFSGFLGGGGHRWCPCVSATAVGHNLDTACMVGPVFSGELRSSVQKTWGYLRMEVFLTIRTIHLSSKPGQEEAHVKKGRGVPILGGGNLLK
jgi:hypothetical protein